MAATNCNAINTSDPTEEEMETHHKGVVLRSHVSWRCKTTSSVRSSFFPTIAIEGTDVVEII